MTSHLVIGSSGLVGEHVLREVVAAGLHGIGTSCSQVAPDRVSLDICAPDDVRRVFDRVRPQVVYLVASLTDVDYCELHPAAAAAVNVAGTRNVVSGANSVGAKIVYVSTDYVFDGVSGPYREDDIANPINEYGRQKLRAEHHVALHAARCVIVRTTVVYGWERLGKNFVYRLVRNVAEGRTVKAPHDQIGTPTYAPNLAAGLVTLGQSDSNGVYHVAGSDRVSRYEMAVTAANVFGLDESLIEPVSTPQLRQPASRPLSAGLVTDRFTRCFDMPMTGCRHGLEQMRAHMETTPCQT